MKISLKWLSKYVEVQEFFKAPEKLDQILTGLGLEVEAVEDCRETYKNVVVGEIVELGRHPDADKLTLCQVDVGGEKLSQIICGAQNHRPGDKVVVALPGAVLPGDFKIKVSSIRGVESSGMLCSMAELGFVEKADGIEILPKDAPIGIDYATYGDFDDIIFDLSITPNRADCLSHIGVARDLSAYLDSDLKVPEVFLKTTPQETSDLATVNLIESSKCPRYAGRGIFGVKVGESPTWLKRAVESLGMNSINNIVDVTNYVMLETGQPLHAFDAAEIAGKKITIDMSQKDECFTTLDGTELKLTGAELMIRDGEKAVALAGIVGGLNSGVTEKTTDVFIETAHFTTEAVRKTARKFKVDTESGFRFARGTDPEKVVDVMNRACQLIQEVAGGSVSKSHIDSYPKKIVREPIDITTEYLRQRLGYEPDIAKFKVWLSRLGCQILSEKGSLLSVQPPFFRWDMLDNVDLVEEYARLNGYDKIPESFPALVHSPTDHDFSYLSENRVAEAMKEEGYLQVVNYNFIGREFQDRFHQGSNAALSSLGVPSDSENPVMVLNPLSDETNAMRVSLSVSLYKNLLHNYRHGNECGRLFETGYCFSKSDDTYVQSHRLGVLAWGQQETLWQKPQQRPTVYDVKTAIEGVFRRLSVSSYQWRKIKREQVPGFIHPGQVMGLFFEGKLAGYMGTLHPEKSGEEKIRHSVAFAEIDLTVIMRGQPRKPKLSSLSKFPSVERDIAFLVPDSVSAVDLVKEIRKAAGHLLQTVRVFDVYRGKGVESGYSSTAFKMVYQDPKETMDEAKLTALQEKVILGVKKKLSVEVR